MELSQRCVLRDGRSVVVLDEGGVACESSPDWERTWVSWEEAEAREAALLAGVVPARGHPI